jgi:hypothetical protein
VQRLVRRDALLDPKGIAADVAPLAWRGRGPSRVDPGQRASPPVLLSPPREPFRSRRVNTCSGYTSGSSSRLCWRRYIL